MNQEVSTPQNLEYWQPTQSPGPSSEKPLLYKIFISFLSAILASFIFVILFFFGANAIFTIGPDSFLFSTLLNPGIIKISTGVSVILIFISAFGGKLLSYSSKPKRLFPFMVVIPLILIGLMAIGWFILTSGQGEAALVAPLFFVIGLILVGPILIFNFVTAKILYLLALEKEKAKQWLIPVSLVVAIFSIFIGIVNVWEFVKNRGIQVTKEDQKVATKQISQEEFDSIASQTDNLVWEEVEKTAYIDPEVKLPLTLIDSNTVLYQVNQPGKGHTNLWASNVLSKERKQITKDIEIRAYLYQKGLKRFAVSPDKTRIAFSTEKGGLFIARLDGAGVFQIAPDLCTEHDFISRQIVNPNIQIEQGAVLVDVACDEIKWSSDSKKIYVHKFRLEEYQYIGYWKNQVTGLRDVSDGYLEITLPDL